METCLDEICDIIQEDVGQRGLRSEPDDNLITWTAGDFQHACRSLDRIKQPSLGIITGFFIPTGTPPAGETDGPLGALFLARALVPLGFRIVLATDDFCTAALRAGLEAARLSQHVPIITLPDFARSHAMGQKAYVEEFFQQAGPLSHLLSLERVGPNYTMPHMLSEFEQDDDVSEVIDNFEREVPEDQRDRCFTMRGRDITTCMSPAHWLMEAVHQQHPPISTLAIGDGGNELGMGSIPWDVIRRNIPRGGLVACRVPVDYLIVSGISNWGAYGLAAALRILWDAPPAPELFDVEREHALLDEMVRNGPLVDGVSGRQTATVDGLEFSRYAEVLTKLAAVHRQ